MVSLGAFATYHNAAPWLEEVISTRRREFRSAASFSGCLALPASRVLLRRQVQRRGGANSDHFAAGVTGTALDFDQLFLSMRPRL